MTCRYSLLDEPLIRTRLAANGQPQSFTLPGLLAALQRDEVRDFPALRPHQRHPWHAFLVQLAAIAMHRAGTGEPFADEAAWRDALLALTPDDPDGAAWCLVSPPDRPAFMQPPVPGELVEKWTNLLVTPDQLDMLVTSKNHDLKAARMVNNLPEDWVYALVSLQTQEGFLGAGNYGISRMNGGFASRPALGIAPKGLWGCRWERDLYALLDARVETLGTYGLNDAGAALLWLSPWDGTQSLSFNNLDPFYIEICRRIRMNRQGNRLVAFASGSKAPRIEAKQLNGQTGDPWTPINIGESKALTLGGKGFDYKLASELAFGTGTYRKPIAQLLRDEDGTEGITILAQAVARGQGKTEGYHERRIPISPKVRRMLRLHQTDQLAATASARVKAIGDMRSVLWTSLVMLFNNGGEMTPSDETKNKANRYARPFELEEDHLFFTDLNAEFEADDPDEARLDWLVAMAQRAEDKLKQAFEAGPRSGEQRYRARAAALSRFHGTLRGARSPLPDLANHYREHKQQMETVDDSA